MFIFVDWFFVPCLFVVRRICGASQTHLMIPLCRIRTVRRRRRRHRHSADGIDFCETFSMEIYCRFRVNQIELHLQNEKFAVSKKYDFSISVAFI